MSRASAIQREIKQRRPFPSRSQEALVTLVRTTDVVKRWLAATLEPSGITLPQYNVLRILRGAGEKGLPTLEIASRVVEQAPGITRLVERLVRKGLVRRNRGVEDRRQVLCRIAPRGLHLLATLDEPMQQVAEGCLRGFSRQEGLVLIRLLDRIRGGRP